MARGGRRGNASSTILIRARFANLADRLSESYWFIPGTFCIAAAGLAFLLAWIEVATGYGVIERIGFGPPIEAESARAILTTIATATISVAGVAFSVLIAAVVFASAQFGPRIIGNFMRDRTNQIALGVFLATFLYCILVLRLVVEGHIPRISILFAYVFAVASVGMLIHFFHHASESIRLSWIISSVGGQLLELVDHSFPTLDKRASRQEAEARGLDDSAAEITALRAGSIRFVELDGLVTLAAGKGLTLHLDRVPGDFAAPGRPLAWAWPAEQVDDEVVKGVRDAFEIGSNRTPAQDLHFLAQQLMDVATRALSPGINDPRTAVACLDWLGAALSRAAIGHPLAELLCDDEGVARVVVRRHGFVGFLDVVIGRLRPHFATEKAASLHMMATLGTLMLDAPEGEQRRRLLEHARLLAEGTRVSLTLQADSDLVHERLQALEEIAAGRLSRAQAVVKHHWL